MLFATLRFYATGSFIQVAGDFTGIDKSTACRIIHKVSCAIARLRMQFIKMPETEEERNAICAQFYAISRFPKCIGALDCTHVRIASPGGPEAEIYRNRKGFFSLNLQAVCDARCRIENIVCRWPGSSHDSTIFNNSQLRAQFERGHYGDHLLVGDSGYAIRRYLITPLGNTRTAAENLFNESQIRTRNPIERTFGIWKRRFPILSLGIRVKLERIEAIVIATAVLHNIAKLYNDPLPDINDEEVEAINFVNVPGQNFVERDREGNNLIRYQLIHEYFTNLLR
ncbi:hypothetical protein RI129_001141 [Pyrocoelia pectoralis]|uniref:Putative nuclease HARBI1 n=1 Tax=Pyrocoelia pectoralis TaxID=417401 RepID=A0AAN7VK71_9COLE